MTFYIAYSEPVRFKYRSTVCSKATLSVVVITILATVFPFLFSYRSHGFWQKHDTYREHPSIQFKYQYLLMLETQHINSPIVCSSIPDIVDFEEPTLCPFIKVHEVDKNLDGLNDELSFEVTAILRENETVYAVSILLLFDFKIQNHCWLQMESAAWASLQTSLPSARLDLVADLGLVQKQSLPCRGRDLRFNRSVVEPTNHGTYKLPIILNDYASRNVTTQMTNVFSVWSPADQLDRSFIFSANIFYPEMTVLYTPGFWQVIKFAWVQYISVAVIFFQVSDRLKKYIFTNHLVHTVKVTPWEKPHHL